MPSSKEWLCGLWLVLSPWGPSCAARQWSTLTAAIVGAIAASLQFCLWVGFMIAPVGEPYASFEACIQSSFQAAFMLFVCIGPILICCLIPLTRLIPGSYEPLGTRVFLLGHVPFLIPWLAWLICALAVQARTPGFDFYQPKPEWIFLEGTGLAGHDAVGIALFGLAAVISLLGLMRAIRGRTAAC